MAKKLVIVESPAKASTIEKYLGKKEYTVKASMGHLRDLPKSQFGVDVENEFAPKYINVKGKAKLIKELQEASKAADMIYLATDPDREGQLEDHHGEQPGMLPLRGQPPGADHSPLRLWLRILAANP